MIVVANILFIIQAFTYKFFFFSSRRRHTRCSRDWSSDVCSSDLARHSKPRRAGWSPTTSSRTCCRSEEHTSELQSRLHLVCRLLLEKKKKNNKNKKPTKRKF